MGGPRKKIKIILLLAILVSCLLSNSKIQAADRSISSQTSDWFFPAKGIISDVFDSRGGVHKGIDIAGNYHTPIYAVDDGIVTRSYRSSSYGNVVFIYHSNGFETVYAHLDERMVKKGEKVNKGEEIGLMGSTGNSTGNHLHFEVHNGKWTISKVNAIDPFVVFGEATIGQAVLALEHRPYPAIEVSGGSTDHLGDNHHNRSIYIVSKNETLWGIAHKHHTTVERLMKMNSLKGKGSQIYPKQKIAIPAEKRRAADH
jgi:murein DD-endopeptidase MepM/ murein hydrolase activator NlpD